MLCRCHACRMAADSATMCVASCVRLYAAYHCGSYHAVIMWLFGSSISAVHQRGLPNMASSSDEYSAPALKCQCTGCSNCNEWRTADTPINVAWFRKTRGRCGGDVKKRNYMNYGCAWCSACYAAGAGETAALPAHGPPLPAAAPSGAEAQVPPTYDVVPAYLRRFKSRLKRRSLLPTKPRSRSQ